MRANCVAHLEEVGVTPGAPLRPAGAGRLAGARRLGDGALGGSEYWAEDAVVSERRRELEGSHRADAKEEQRGLHLRVCLDRYTEGEAILSVAR